MVRQACAVITLVGSLLLRVGALFPETVLQQSVRLSLIDNPPVCYCPARSMLTLSVLVFTT